MKEFILLRHAKSNRNYDVADIDRPLATTGMLRIYKVANQYKELFENVDCVFSSPANRALHTATIMMNELQMPFYKLNIDNALYTFDSDDIIDYIFAIDDELDKVVLVGHNPAFTFTLNHFSNAGISHIRTAGLAKVSFNVNSWTDVNKGSFELGQPNNI
jgi:phosphohistidine phosphatase